MTKSKKPRVRCTHGNADLTPSGHCRICDRARRQEYHVVQKMRSSAAKEAALARGDRVGPLYEKDESVRVNRILELMDQHWRAATPWERAELDAEIKRLSRMG